MRLTIGQTQPSNAGEEPFSDMDYAEYLDQELDLDRVTRAGFTTRFVLSP